jgi:Uncharacterized protein conserved in bacteria
MKLVIAVVSNDDGLSVGEALRNAGFYSTKLATTGGFLKAGNTTFMIGTEDENVDKCVEVIGAESKTRTEIMPAGPAYDFGVYSAMPLEVQVGGATIFVLDIDQFIKL